MRFIHTLFPILMEMFLDVKDGLAWHAEDEVVNIEDDLAVKDEDLDTKDDR